MSRPLRVSALIFTMAALIAPAAYGASAAKTPAKLDGGKKLYRKYCGQCHALKEALAVGIGLGGKGADKGENDMAGPSFNELRVTAHQCLLAITGVWDGHAKVMTLMTREDMNLVSAYTQAATRDHKYKATLPSDFFR